MPASFGDIISSNLVKFVIGLETDGRSSEFFVHEKAISQLSPQLSTLTNSNKVGSPNGISWGHVTKETFERFVQFAYTGDYSIPKPSNQRRLAQNKAPPVNGTYQTASLANANGYRRRNTSVESEPIPINALSDTTLQDLTQEGKHNLERRMSSSEKDAETSNIQPASVGPTTKRKNRKKKRGQIQDPETETEPIHVPEEEAPILEEVILPQEAPSPSTWAPAVPEPTESDPADSEPDTAHLDFKNRKFQNDRQTSLIGDFESLSYPVSEARDHYYGTCEPSSEFEANKSYSDILLCHASLYVLGDKYLITSLRTLALYKLHKTLCIFQLSSFNAADITDLGSYAYAEDFGDYPEDSNGGIRGLVCQYMATHAKELSEDISFMNLLAGGGQIVKDFVKLQLLVK